MFFTGRASLPPEREADAGLLKSLELYDSDRLCIAKATCAELARMTVNEFTAEQTGDGQKSPALGDFLAGMKRTAEMLCKYGEVVIKPYYSPGGIREETLDPFRYKVTETDGDGNPSGGEFTSLHKVGKKTYIRIERHTRCGNGYLIENTFRVKDNESGRISPAKAEDVRDWKDIRPATYIENLRKPLFTRISLCSETGGKSSPVFRRGEELIREADRQLERLIWEYEGGELAVDASEDAFRVGRNGRPELPSGKERLWRTNCLDACSSQNELLKIFAPGLRDGNYIKGLDRLLMHYEDAVGLSRGTFSELHNEMRTASEVRAGRERTLSLCADIRRELIKGLHGVIEDRNAMNALYGFGRNALTVTLGDGIIDGKEKVITIG